MCGNIYDLSDLEFVRLPRPNRCGRNICFRYREAPGWHFLILENTGFHYKIPVGSQKMFLQGPLSCIFLFTLSKQLISFLPFSSSLAVFQSSFEFYLATGSHFTALSCANITSSYTPSKGFNCLLEPLKHSMSNKVVLIIPWGLHHRTEEKDFRLIRS